MPAPAMSLAATRLYQQVAHLEVADPVTGYDPDAEGYPWAAACIALAAPIDSLYDLLFSTASPWEAAFDVDRCPAWLLPWLGNFVGVEVDTTLSEDGQRQQLRDAPARKRGTIAGWSGAIKRTLTGDQRVVIYERVGGDAFSTLVVTYATETPDAAVTERVVRANCPARLLPGLTYVTSPSWIIADMEAAYATIADLEAAFTTIRGLENDTP